MLVRIERQRLAMVLQIALQSLEIGKRALGLSKCRMQRIPPRLETKTLSPRLPRPDLATAANIVNLAVVSLLFRGWFDSVVWRIGFAGLLVGRQWYVSIRSRLRFLRDIALLRKNDGIARDHRRSDNQNCNCGSP
jgi:hypothetical protein